MRSTGLHHAPYNPCRRATEGLDLPRFCRLLLKKCRTPESSIAATVSMASIAFAQHALRPKPYICARCAIRASRTSKRQLSGTFITREIEKELAWKEQAKLIREGKKKSMLSILEERGYIKQIAGYSSLHCSSGILCSSPNHPAEESNSTIS
jgi:hypothetical protein